jgi:preprotein translocase subunit YajC
LVAGLFYVMVYRPGREEKKARRERSEDGE